MLFTKHFWLNLFQRELDFVDVNLEKDTPLFIDPFAIQMREDEWAERAISAISWYFELIIKCIANENIEKAKRLLINKEPQEVCLGLSRVGHSGRAVWIKQSNDLFEAFATSAAIKSWLLQDLEESILFIENIWKDKISDLTCNLIKKYLIVYTQEQSHLYDISLSRVPINLFWDDVNMRWSAWYFDLPVYKGKPIILVPKSIVRLENVFKHDEYYSGYVLDFLQSEHLESNSSLVEVLKNGTRRVTKESLKQIHPLSKDYLVSFTQENLEILDIYKDDKKKEFEYLDDSVIEGIQDINTEIFSYDDAASELTWISPWAQNASEFHESMLGILNSVFVPEIFVSPVKEHPIHDGRKRIDVTYQNNASIGFFAKLREIIPSGRVVIECKNYAWDPKNPELDQISGRFSPSRGQIGFLICRTLGNRSLFDQRCIDTAKDGRGYIMALDDTDILQLLAYKKSWRKDEIENFFVSKWNSLFSSLLVIS